MRHRMFVITKVCRMDVAEALGGAPEAKAKAKRLTNDNMERLARLMEDDYVEQLYWSQIRDLIDVVLEGV